MQDGKNEVCMEVKEQISSIESSKIILKKKSVRLEEFMISVGEKEQKFSGVLFNKEKRIKECFDRQEVFGICISNGISWQEFIGRSVRYEILPMFIYETPDQSGEFCAVYIAESAITDLRLAGLYNEMLMKIFPEADSRSKDITRVFRGGRKIVYSETKNRLTLENLVLAFHVAMKRVDSHNFKRNVENVAKKYGIACEKGFLKIYNGNLVENIPNNVMMIGNMVVEYGKNKRKFIPISQEGKKNERELKSKITTISGIDTNKMRMYCQLYKDFVEKGISDIHKRLLLTNLRYIKRGKTIFFKGIKEENELVWNCIWTQSKVYNYIPIECNAGGCPYKSICQTKSLYSKLLGQVISLKTEKTYVSIREAENEFKQYLDEAVDEKKKMICLIKAQTSLGKTQAYCNLVANKTDRVYMIAVPTLKLQEEVARKLQNKGVNCIKTVSCIEIAKEMNLSICKELDLLYKCGYDDKVKGTLKKYKSEHEDELSDVQNLRLEKCLNQLDTLDGSCCVVTTHNMILNLPVHILEKYEIIIDEDLLMSIFRDGGSVCENKLREAFRLSIFKDDAQERLKEQGDDVSIGVYSRLWDVLEGDFFRKKAKPFQKGMLNILSFKGISPSTQCHLIEIFMGVLWCKLRVGDSPATTSGITLSVDELQNLSVSRKSVLFELLTEARKYKLHLILATQSISVFDRMQISVLNQCATTLLFKSAANDLEKLLKLMNFDDKDTWRRILKNLQIGQAVTIGTLSCNGRKITSPVITTMSLERLTERNTMPE